MNSKRILREEQVEQFHRDGFLVVRGMYSSEETTAMIAIDANSTILKRETTIRRTSSAIRTRFTASGFNHGKYQGSGITG
jgi:hypothetical protein